MTRTRTIVLLSGGVDSYACAHFLLNQRKNLQAVFFQYGQAALTQERRSARKIANRLKVSLSIASLDLGRKFGKGEVVGRNAIMVLSALPRLRRPGQIVMGIHAGTPYYDCSDAFAQRIDTLVQEYTDGTAKFFAPFLHWTKGQIIDYCRDQKIDLSLTYSCEEGGKKPCHRCASCRDRIAHHVS